MKPHYEVCPRFRGKGWVYGLRWGSAWFRPIRTAGELRQREADRVDGRHEWQPIKRRGKRSNSRLDAWNDIQASRSGGKSWKDYTKRPAQYRSR